MTKQPPASQSQGLMANPELSNILKNSLFSQVNVSIGTAGVSRGGETSKNNNKLNRLVLLLPYDMKR